MNEMLRCNMQHGDIGNHAIPDLLVRRGVILSYDIKSNAGKTYENRRPRVGSLIWNKGKLRLTTNWTDGGPVLPIEFSQISDDWRLTLVIDERHEVDVPTRYAFSFQ